MSDKRSISCVSFHSQPCHVSTYLSYYLSPSLGSSVYRTLSCCLQMFDSLLLFFFFLLFLFFGLRPTESLFYISLANVIFGAGELQNIEGGMKSHFYLWISLSPGSILHFCSGFEPALGIIYQCYVNSSC
ncbi:hypothetical protein P170DRAFT_179362 [Aspergillus steynii IBT 23096]|uniref:Uncharacterized protein n=1 Tax=Aspergillus steynii IBT 23096 TaxID=1392250 RepID=A0A2I2G8T1_9EURO|nr:uncharacterized protein P170DRAFT_179362 [Aspergillus steynii IBT 23096]PLB49284.1 hypothetical protein P170DRAFT_179362 [Aspergillus steynii IBT 23096]